jgi:hypothetical protein
MEDKMTIFEAITKINEIKPNSYPQSVKIGWLDTLDRTVKGKIIDTHEGAEAVKFEGYTEDTDLSTQLLIPAPYDEVYVFWLESKIDYSNGEYGRYNNTVAMFNTAYAEFDRYYNRTHMPIGEKLKFF